MIECLTPEPAQRLAACNAIVDPAASSYFVYRVDLGTNELQMTNNPTIPVFSLSGSPRPAGSVLTAFLNARFQLYRYGVERRSVRADRSSGERHSSGAVFAPARRGSHSRRRGPSVGGGFVFIPRVPARNRDHAESR